MFDHQMMAMASDQSPRESSDEATAEESRSGDAKDEDQGNIKCSEDYAHILASQPTDEPWQQWTPEEVERQLIEKGIPEVAAQKFKDHKIGGKALSYLTPEDIRTILEEGESGTEKKIQEETEKKIDKFLKSLGFRDFDNVHPDGSKVFNDPVHGHMEFHPLLVKIMDTPQFQRLRYLKQLGGCYFVYPGAAHNRFEHSLGVCYLAGELVSALQKRQPRLDITDKDVLCVQIAGLCHDLGHGPFSHLFDKQFIPKIKQTEGRWEYEEASIAMFDYMVNLKANQLKPVFENYGLTEEDRVGIKELIVGKPLSKNAEGAEVWRYGPKKAFLYEIVANKRNGVDVAKWDYLKRDCLHLGMTSSFDHSRFIKFARVIQVEEELQICVRDKEAFHMYQMFVTRHALHLSAYQHKTTQAVEIMLVEAMKEADDYILIPGENRNRYKMSECIEHMDAYTNLTDSIFHLILMSEIDNEHIKRAKEILDNIQRRRLYKRVGESVPFTEANPLKKSDETIKMELLEELSHREAEVEELELKTSRFVIQLVNLDFGKQDQDPVNDVRFFSKDNLNKAVPVRPSEVSSMLPQVWFKERLVRVFLRPTGDDDIDRRSSELLEEAFVRWCLKNTMKEPKMRGQGRWSSTDAHESDRSSQGDSATPHAFV